MNMRILYFGHPFIRRLAFALGVLSAPLAVSAGEIQAWLLLLPSATAPASIISTDYNERDALVKGGWKVSGTGLLQTGSGPDRGAVNRMVRTVDGMAERAIEADAKIVAQRKAEGFVTEGVLGYASLRETAGGVAVKRYTKDGHVIWVIDPADEKWAADLDWKPDGVAFWLAPKS